MPNWPNVRVLVLVCGTLALTAACSGGSGGEAAAPPQPPSPSPPTPSGQIVVQADLPSSANSIAASLGAARSDPENVAPAAPNVSLMTWKDARGADRAMTLYGYLYQYDFSFVGGSADPNQEALRSANDDAYGHEGFGYVVSHNTQNGNSPLGKANAPTRVTSTVFAGGHHAIHQIEVPYDRDKEGGGNGVRIPVVIEWFVATGRDHPVWAVNYKMSEVQNPNGVDLDAYRMDVRGPYGSLNFDGAATRNAGDAVGGVAWGDHALRFGTQGAQLNMNSSWTYDVPNRVNFTRAWTASVNAEMGIVQTRVDDKTLGYPDRVVGRERGSTSAGNFPGKFDCLAFEDNRNYSMPCVTGWPYQLMNYDWGPTTGKALDEASGTKLIAWGSPYGWLGASSFSLFDYSAMADGRGDRSYSTFIVLGPKCRVDGAGACTLDGDVETTLKNVEALSAATISDVTAGVLATDAPRGPGSSARRDLVQGYDDTYAVHSLQAQSNRAAFTFAPAAGRPVVAPIFVIRDFTLRQVPAVRVNGVPLSVNDGTSSSGAFASIDTRSNELWVTINRTLASDASIEIGP